MQTASIQQKLQRLRHHYDSGITKSYTFRKQQLQKLKDSLLAHEQAIYDAIYADLQKSSEESWVTEIGFVLGEIRTTLKQLRYWMQPVRVSTNLLNLPSRSYILKEPLGVVLIIGPWNYPLQLLFAPLIGAIAAGNCVVLKPSELAPATAAIMGTIIKEVFAEDHVLYMEGDGASVIPPMLEAFRFDHIFYTGGMAVGRSIYQQAAAQLTPVTLELGGKSPCVVESDANIKITARRIAVTKFSNTGQMCIAPDYVLVHQSKKEELVQALKEAIQQFYSNDPKTCYNYGKIINEKQFKRLTSYLQQGTIIHGGGHDLSKLYIQPTLIDNVPLDAPLMKEEIFGPILPIYSFSTADEAKAIIRNNPDPLAFYIYTANAAKEKAWLQDVAFGGGCVNNSSWHFTNTNLPFGGRGNSGFGKVHGKYSFDVFSHAKSVMKTPAWFDPSMKYPPFKGKLKLFKWFIR